MKRIFYYTDVLPFLSKEIEAIDLLAQELALFKSESDRISLVFHPWSKTEEYLILNNSPVVERYRDILNSFKSEGYGILDTCMSLPETMEVLRKCDAYYGDISDLAYFAQDIRIPYMIRNMNEKEQLSAYISRSLL